MISDLTEGSSKVCGLKWSSRPVGEEEQTGKLKLIKILCRESKGF